MPKICPQCKTEMRRIGNKITIAKGCILKYKGDDFLYKDTYGDLDAFNYICLQCGLVQQYIPDELLEYLNQTERS